MDASSFGRSVAGSRQNDYTLHCPFLAALPTASAPARPGGPVKLAGGRQMGEIDIMSEWRGAETDDPNVKTERPQRSRPPLKSPKGDRPGRGPGPTADRSTDLPDADGVPPSPEVAVAE